MFKKLRLPLLAVLALQFVLTPAADAAYSKSLYKDLLSEIYKKSDLGDGGDIYLMIKKALAENPNQGSDLVNKLISELEDNLDQLAFDVSKEDLRRVKKQLRKYIKKRDAALFVTTPTQGNVAPPESTVQNP
jgi:hypothetical protein